MARRQAPPARNPVGGRLRDVEQGLNQLNRSVASIEARLPDVEHQGQLIDALTQALDDMLDRAQQPDPHAPALRRQIRDLLRQLEAAGLDVRIAMARVLELESAQRHLISEIGSRDAAIDRQAAFIRLLQDITHGGQDLRKGVDDMKSSCRGLPLWLLIPVLLFASLFGACIDWLGPLTRLDRWFDSPVAFGVVLFAILLAICVFIWWMSRDPEEGRDDTYFRIDHAFRTPVAPPEPQRLIDARTELARWRDGPNGLTAKQAELDAKLLELDNARAELLRLTGELVVKGNEADAKRVVVVNKSGELMTLRGQLTALEAQLVALQAAVPPVPADILAKQNEIRLKGDAIKAKQAEIETATGELNPVVADLKRLTDLSEAQRAIGQQANAAIGGPGGLQTIVNGLKREFARAQAELDAATKAYDRLKTEPKWHHLPRWAVTYTLAVWIIVAGGWDYFNANKMIGDARIANGQSVPWYGQSGGAANAPSSDRERYIRNSRDGHVVFTEPLEARKIGTKWIVFLRMMIDGKVPTADEVGFLPLSPPPEPPEDSSHK